MKFSFINSTIASIWLYFSGLGSGLRLDRAAIFLLQEPQIASKVANCVLLNGAVFLGTISFLSYIIQPTIKNLLTASLSQTTASHAILLFDTLFNTFWLLPAYVITFFISSMWYGELAELTAIFVQRETQRKLAEASGVVTPTTSQLLQATHRDPLIALSQEVYRSLLFCIFFILIILAGKLPYIGHLLNFIMMSWNYALYCFDYKWSLYNVALQHRIAMVEEGWAYFAGFGSSMVIIIVCCSFYVGAAIIGVIFPLFIITASIANPKEAYMQVKKHYENKKVAFVRLPIFRLAISITNSILRMANFIARMLGFTSSTSSSTLKIKRKSKTTTSVGVKGGSGRRSGSRTAKES